MVESNSVNQSSQEMNDSKGNGNYSHEHSPGSYPHSNPNQPPNPEQRHGSESYNNYSNNHQPNNPYPNAQSSNNPSPHNPYPYDPYTYNPYYYPPYNPYFYQPRKAKKFLGLTIGGWVVLSVIAFFGLSAYGMYSILNSSSDSVTEENFSQEVIISEGGYFRFIPDDYYYDEIEITLSISERDNKTFDVYLLDEDQFFNAYYNNVTNVSFSARYSFENTSVIEQFIPWTDEFYDDLIIVIDNRELDITPNDASPDGKIIVDVDITIRTRWEYAFD